MKILKVSILAITIILFQAIIQPANAAHHKKKKRHTTTTRQDNDQDSLRKNAFLAFPMSLFASDIKLGYERLLNNGKGLQFQVSYATGDQPTFYDLKSFDEYSLELQYKIGFKNTNKWSSGFYMAPFISYRALNGIYQYETGVYYGSGQVITQKVKATSFTPGYLVGFQKTVSDFFVFGFYAGGGLNITSGDYENVNTSLGLYNKGVVAHFGLSIGVLF